VENVNSLHSLIQTKCFTELQDQLHAFPERIFEREQSRTLAHTAVLSKQLAALEYILSVETSLMNERDQFGSTPLHSVAEVRYSGKAEIQELGLKMVKVLISAGAMVNAKDNGGRTTLNTICHHVGLGWHEIIVYLIMNGADVNAPDSFGNTPLHGLAYDSDILLPIDYYKILLSNGADCHLKNDRGQTPLNLIKEYCSINKKSAEVLCLMGEP